jgi:hypothetical protein
MSLFIAEFLFHDFAKLGNLLRSQIRRDILGIRVEQQNHISAHSPVVDDARATTLAPLPNCHSGLANPAATFDDGAELGIRSEPRLKLAKLFVREQSRNLARKH